MGSSRERLSWLNAVPPIPNLPVGLRGLAPVPTGANFVFDDDTPHGHTSSFRSDEEEDEDDVPKLPAANKDQNSHFSHFSFVNNTSWRNMARTSADLIESAVGPEAVDMVSWVLSMSSRISGTARFEHLVGLTILIDIIATAMEVDHYDQARIVFDSIAVYVTIIYLGEMILRMAEWSSHRLCDSLLVLDTLLVVAAIFDLVIRFTPGIFRGNATLIVSVVGTLRIFRLVRVARISQFFIQQIPAMHLLLDAIQRAAAPVMQVVALACTMAFGFTLMLTSLVTASWEEPKPVVDLLLEHFGSIPDTAWTLLTMFYGSQWGLDIVLELHDMTDHPVITLLLLVLMLANLVLTVVLSSLLCGTFLSVLEISAEAREAETKYQECKRLQTHIKSLLDFMQSQGVDQDDALAWPELQNILIASGTVWEDIGLEIEDAHNVFLHLDVEEQGTVSSMAEFLQAIYDMVAFPRSIDKVSLDLQHDKALHKMTELKEELQHFACGLQTKLVNMGTLLSVLDRQVTRIQMDVVEVQELELDLVQRRDLQRSQSADNSVTAGMSLRMPRLTAEELTYNSALNRRLCQLEDAVARASGELRKNRTNKDALIDLVADDIVSSVQAMLLAELDELHLDGPPNADASTCR